MIAKTSLFRSSSLTKPISDRSINSFLILSSSSSVWTSMNLVERVAADALRSSSRVLQEYSFLIWQAARRQKATIELAAS